MMRYFAIAACGAVVASVLLVAPALVGAMTQGLGFTPQQAGYVISAELAGLSLASLPAFWWLKRWNWKRVATVSLLVTAAADAAAILIGEFQPLVLLRFCTALSAGNVMVITIVACGSAADAQRSYSAWVIAQLIVGAVGLALLPEVFARFGVGAFYAIHAGASLLLVPLVRHLPEGLARNGPSAIASISVVGLIALCGVLLFYVALSGVWTFVERIGASKGYSLQLIGYVLSAATVAGIVGCLVAGSIGQARFRLPCVALGYALLVASILALAAFSELTSYMLSAATFKFTWTFTLPFMLAIVASLDRDGRLMTSVNIVIGAGLAIGPLVASSLLAREVTLSAMLRIMSAAGLASACMMIVSATRSRQGAAGATAAAGGYRSRSL